MTRNGKNELTDVSGSMNSSIGTSGSSERDLIRRDGKRKGADEREEAKKEGKRKLTLLASSALS